MSGPYHPVNDFMLPSGKRGERQAYPRMVEEWEEKVPFLRLSPLINGLTLLGIVMSLHLFYADLAIPQDQPSSSRLACELRLLAAYEDGSVVLRRFPHDSPKQTSVEGIGWEVIFSAKLHKEASETLISSSLCL
jgi:hypothetical protein